MLIQGIQKLTLLDYPEHTACTIFLGGCDFRCPFCHNFELVKGTSLPFRNEFIADAPPAMEEEEFMEFLSKRRGLLDGVAITGGEPCLRKDLPDFMARIRDMGFLVKLDTNGNHPEMLKNVIDQRLVNYVAMDIKNSPGKYAETVGLMALDLDPIMESIAFLLEGKVPYEFRTTVIDEFHSAEDFHKMGKMIEGAEKHFLQPFTDRDQVPRHDLSAPDEAHLIEYLDIAKNYVKVAAIRGQN